MEAPWTEGRHGVLKPKPRRMPIRVVAFDTGSQATLESLSQAYLLVVLNAPLDVPSVLHALFPQGCPDSTQRPAPTSHASMATPASSATSPSPPMAYLSHTPPIPQATTSAAADVHERDQRQKAVQKFLARAEISMVSRCSRSRTRRRRRRQSKT